MPDNKSWNPFQRAADELSPKPPAPKTPSPAKPSPSPKYTGPEYEVLPDEHWVDMNRSLSKITSRINSEGQEIMRKRLLKQSPKTNGSKK